MLLGVGEEWCLEEDYRDPQRTRCQVGEGREVGGEFLHTTRVLEASWVTSVPEGG